MNSALLNNLTDREFLKQVEPQTELERALYERLEARVYGLSEVERRKAPNDGRLRG